MVTCLHGWLIMCFGWKMADGQPLYCTQQVHTYVHTYAHNIYRYVYVYIRTYVCTYNVCILMSSYVARNFKGFKCIHTYVCTYVRTYINVIVYITLHPCISTYIRIYCEIQIFTSHYWIW